MAICREHSTGFTLVELLIVVAIIGILAAIAIPQFTRYKRGAVGAKVEASIMACASSLGAEVADNSSIKGRECFLASGVSCRLMINNAEEIIDNATNSCALNNVVVDGYLVNCSITTTNSVFASQCDIQ